MKTLKKPLSFSQIDLFLTCPRTWYYKYILKIEGVEDLKFAHRGSVAHYCLEKYYPDKKITISSLRDYFNAQWGEHKLYGTSLKDQKENTWQMVMNGINYDLSITDVEEEITFEDAKGFIDAADRNNLIITDWKTSTRSEHNEKSYKKQLAYYSWLYYRKYNVLPKKAQVLYLKYSDERSKLSITPTMELIKKVKQWNYNVKKRMEFYLNNPDKLPSFNREYFFSPYKHLFFTEHDKSIKTLRIVNRGHYLHLYGYLPKKLINFIDKIFYYEKKDAFFIKKRNPNANTEVHFFNQKNDTLPAGFLLKLIKALKYYFEKTKNDIDIKYSDAREFNKEIALLFKASMDSITLRDYQQKISDDIVKRPGYWMVSVATGGGKSLIITDVIRRLGYKTLVVVDKKELLKQLKDDFETHIFHDIGVIGEGGIDLGKHVTIATIQTLRKRLNNKERLNDYKRIVKLQAFNKHENEKGITHPSEKYDDEFIEDNLEVYNKELKIYEQYKYNFIRKYKFTENEKIEISKKDKQYLQEKSELQEYLSTIRVWITDEAHKIASYSYYALGIEMKNTEYRLGFTGTAYRDDGNDMMITAVSGYKITDLQSRKLINEGYLMNPEITFLSYTMDKEYVLELKNKSLKGLINEKPNYIECYKNFIVNNTFRNDIIKRIVNYESNKQILIVVKYLDHGEHLKELIEGSEYLNGKTSKKKRDDLMKRFANGDLKILISTINIFAEGINIPGLEVVINAAANSGDVKTVQLLGRVLRKAINKTKASFYDFYDKDLFFSLATHNRMSKYKKLGYEVKKADAYEYLEH